MKKKKDAIKNIITFEEKEIRRVWHNEQWFVVIEDVVQALINSKDVKQYIKRMRQRDSELNKGWVQLVPILMVKTKGGFQKMNCASLQGIFRIIQSIPSSKAEPFKRWLAKVGRERIEEIQNPDHAITRSAKIYRQKGYSENWINKRIKSISIRNTLTDEWKNRGVKEGVNFAILTNEIYNGIFEMTAREIRDYKKLTLPDKSRDNMGEMELILTMLGEATVAEITRARDSKNIPSLKNDAKEGGEIAGNTRKQIETKTGKKIIKKKLI